MSNGAAHYAAELSFFAASDGGKVAEMINAGGSALRHMSLAVVELQPGKALLHRHIQTEEIYYILAGAGIIHLDKIYRPVGPGDAVSIPVGCIHALENPSAETLRYLAISAPGFDPADMQFY
ncbi:hypothetical protein DMH27_05555 [Raoultella planticola]|nr:hypothetical protein [Raoultella planticola]